MSADKTDNSRNAHHDRLTELLRLWAARYSQPVENLSAARLVELIERFLREGASHGKAATGAPQRRWDHERIENIIPSGSRVLDLGCGSGELLESLVRGRGARAQGVELDPYKVAECVRRGVSVFQTDLDQGLAGFPDNFYDYVILEETLQTVHHPVQVLSEMLRIGRRGIISFPNFGYWRVRLELGFGGRMPVFETLPFSWAETPNIHLFTIDDFLAWAEEHRVSLIEGYVLCEGEVRALAEGDNLFAEEALMVVQNGN